MSRSSPAAEERRRGARTRKVVERFEPGGDAGMSGAFMDTGQSDNADGDPAGQKGKKRQYDGSEDEVCASYSSAPNVRRE